VHNDNFQSYQPELHSTVYMHNQSEFRFIDIAIAVLWQNHFQQLFNSVHDGCTEDSLIKRISGETSGRGDVALL